MVFRNSFPEDVIHQTTSRKPTPLGNHQYPTPAQPIPSSHPIRPINIPINTQIAPPTLGPQPTCPPLPPRNPPSLPTALKTPTDSPGAYKLQPNPKAKKQKTKTMTRTTTTTRTNLLFHFLAKLAILWLNYSGTHLFSRFVNYWGYAGGGTRIDTDAGTGNRIGTGAGTGNTTTIAYAASKAWLLVSNSTALIPYNADTASASIMTSSNLGNVALGSGAAGGVAWPGLYTPNTAADTGTTVRILALQLVLVELGLVMRRRYRRRGGGLGCLCAVLLPSFGDGWRFGGFCWVGAICIWGFWAWVVLPRMGNLW